MKRTWRALPALIAVAWSCSLGEGTGTVESARLYAEDCWDGRYDLVPDFFAAEPFRDTMHIRVQRGSDLIEFSDGIDIVVNGVADVRGRLGEALPVTLPPGVAPPGFPEGSLCEGCTEHPVHMSVYLLQSCHNANKVLYALSGTMTFEELFSGDPNEDDAAEKLTKATFDVLIGDPQKIIPGGPDAGTIPDQSRLTGSFEFFFQRGQPAQPFP